MMNPLKPSPHYGRVFVPPAPMAGWRLCRQFSRHNLEVFKGVNLSTSDYHYLQSLLAPGFLR